VYAYLKFILKFILLFRRVTSKFSLHVLFQLPLVAKVCSRLAFFAPFLHQYTLLAHVEITYIYFIIILCLLGKKQASEDSAISAWSTL